MYLHWNDGDGDEWEICEGLKENRDALSLNTLEDNISDKNFGEHISRQVFGILDESIFGQKIDQSLDHLC